MSIKISDHFTYRRLLRFTAPTAIMVALTSVYGVVDGLFVSHFVGKESFAALNLIYPLIMMVGALGFMFGTGGTALVAKIMGEGDNKRARGLFSLIVYTMLAVGIVAAITVLILVRPVGQLMGAEGILLDQAVLYGGILACSLPFLMLQYSAVSFLNAASKPKIGLCVEVCAGLINVLLDAVLIVGLDWGLAGAAIATAASEVVGGGIPLVYFARKNSGALRLGRPIVDFRALGRSCMNGLSELVTNISMSFVAMLYNYQLMHFIGTDGVAAYGVIQYVVWIFTSVLMGYSVGCSSIVAYHHGAQNHDELKGLLRKSRVILGVAGVVLVAAAQVFARPLAEVFIGYDQAVCDMTVEALRLYSLMFLLVGCSVFSSAFFTALNNGVVSASISFLRTMVFEAGAVMLLPMLLGAWGIWLSAVVAELIAFTVANAFLFGFRKHYGYA